MIMPYEDTPKRMEHKIIIKSICNALVETSGSTQTKRRYRCLDCGLLIYNLDFCKYHCKDKK
jgi:hypothetical protein